MKAALLLFLLAACAGGSPAGVPPGEAVASGTGGLAGCAVEPLATWPTASVECATAGSYAAANVAIYPSGVLVFDTETAQGLATTDDCLVLPTLSE